MQTVLIKLLIYVHKMVIFSLYTRVQTLKVRDLLQLLLPFPVYHLRLKGVSCRSFFSQIAYVI